MLDFVVLEEGEEYGAALMEKTFSKALEAAPGVNISKKETVTVTFPAGWNWVREEECCKKTVKTVTNTLSSRRSAGIHSGIGGSSLFL